MLGNGSSSRLFQRLREGEGLTYDIWSGLALRDPGGLLEIGWACAPEVNDEVWSLVLDEVERLPRDLSDDEVSVALEGLRRGLLMDSDLPMARCAMDVAEVLDRGRRFDLDHVRAELDAVTIDGVRELAESILRRTAWPPPSAAQRGASCRDRSIAHETWALQRALRCL